MKIGIVNLFLNLKKEDIIEELEKRLVWLEKEIKSEVQEKFVFLLYGVVWFSILL